jgi:hypothetical protein
MEDTPWSSIWTDIYIQYLISAIRIFEHMDKTLARLINDHDRPSSLIEQLLFLHASKVFFPLFLKGLDLQSPAYEQNLVLFFHNIATIHRIIVDPVMVKNVSRSLRVPPTWYLHTQFIGSDLDFDFSIKETLIQFKDTQYHINTERLLPFLSLARFSVINFFSTLD